MTPETPTVDDLRRIASEYDFAETDEDLTFFRNMMAPSLESFRRLDEMDSQIPPPDIREGVFPPDPAQNSLGAWYWKCSIKGADGGPLSGKTIAMKDNVCVAGVPMMNGSAVLEGYIPDVDATIVTRVLRAGAEIIGKSVCENLCASGSSFSSATGPVLNPHDHSRSAGGSSSGSAALVAAGDVDLAVGGDQGGSIRIPASWCGTYGLKPTFGLVPYTGISSVEPTLDHAGPIARTVTDLAQLLEAMAGDDGLDPRQRNIRTDAYTSALNSGIAGARIGVVREGFDWPNSDPEVDKAVDDAAFSFEKFGATVGRVSIPAHRDGTHVFTGIVIEGTMATMIDGNSMGFGWKGRYVVSLMEAFAEGRVSRSNDLPDTTKLMTLLGRYMRKRYHGRYYAKAQNLVPALKRAYDAALDEYDVLVMPTTPMLPTLLPTSSTNREGRYDLHLNMNKNTAPFDVTGHPAVSIPCGRSGSLPIGMMLIGRDWDESMLLRVARAFEEAGAYT